MKPTQFQKRFLTNAALLAAIISGPLFAAESWLQWGGPSRNFIVDSKGLASKWPEDGPKKLWTRALGDGYSAIAVDGDRLYTLYCVRDKTPKSLKGDEFVVCLDAKTGKTIWEEKYEAPWLKHMQMEFGPGPHSTPLIVGNRLFTIGVTDKFKCFDKMTGKGLWSHDLTELFKVKVPGRGYAVSPIAYKDTVILTVGGKGHSVVAFNQKDGSVAWQKQDFEGSDSSPIIIDVEGQKQLVVFMGKEIAGLNPDDGELLWSHKSEGGNISTPVFGEGNTIFMSSAYGAGSRMIKLTRDGDKTSVKELWFNPKMQIHHGNAVIIGDTIYGSSGQMGPSFFGALDAKTGEFKWRKRGISKANCVYADGKFIILDEDGHLILAKAKDDELKVLSKVELLKRTAWTVPTLVKHTLYVRDSKSIMALDVGAMASS